MVTERSQTRAILKRKRNDKQGINRANNYEYIPFAPRKKYYNCGNCNHLANDRRKNKKKPKAIHKSDVAGRTMNVIRENPCFH